MTPKEISERATATLAIIRKIRREMALGRQGHWSYSRARHLMLLTWLDVALSERGLSVRLHH